jgi:hypothetical protein
MVLSETYFAPRTESFYTSALRFIMDHTYPYDLFISHAVEDKIPLVNELAARLEAQGIKVWYTGQELSIGDEVCNTLVAGMRQSRCGVIIFSRSYISKMTSSAEFSTLLQYKRNGKKVIIPVIFEVTSDELAAKHILPDSADAIYTTAARDDVVSQIVQQIGPVGSTPSVSNTSIFQTLASPKGKLYAALLFVVGLILMLYGFSVLLS